MFKPFARCLLPVLALSVLSMPASGLDMGDLMVRGRLINIEPDSSSSNVNADGNSVPGTNVTVDSAMTLDIDFVYMLTPVIGVELLLDLSSQHSISSEGNTLFSLAPGTIMKTRVLPPALILQYHLAPYAILSPYVGAGLNYTYFFDTKATDSLESGLKGVSDIDLDPSFGWVVQVGADYDLGNEWYLNADLKYMQIDTKASFYSGLLGNVDLSVDINPWVMGIGVGKRF